MTTTLPKAGLGACGVYIGRHQHGGSFVYDPWVLYTQGAAHRRQRDRHRPAGLGQDCRRPRAS